MFISISIEDVEDGTGYVNSLTSSLSRESTSELSSSLHSEMAGGDQQLQDQQDLVPYNLPSYNFRYVLYHGYNTAHESYYQ